MDKDTDKLEDKVMNSWTKTYTRMWSEDMDKGIDRHRHRFWNWTAPQAKKFEVKHEIEYKQNKRKC